MEKNHKKELIDLFIKFHNLSKKDNFVYVAQCGTLLGAIRENKMIEWDDDIDLGIPLETYYYLKEKYPNNILDTHQNGYPFFVIKWVNDKSNYLNSNVFLDLFLIIPTTKKRLKKYSNPWNVFRFSNQMFNKGTNWKAYDFKHKLLKSILWLVQWMTKKYSIDEAISILHEKQNPEFNQFINSPNSNLKSEQRPNNIWDRKEINFENTKLFIPTNYDECLRRNYGENYMTPIKSKKNIKHIDVINITKA